MRNKSSEIMKHEYYAKDGKMICGICGFFYHVF
jgi:hypothetical protein